MPLGMDLTVVVVHYHTPELAREGVLALRQELAAMALDCELVVVDNGSDAAGRAVLSALPARLLVPERNLGYAGGVNLGLSSASARWLMVMNADVRVLPGCVAALVAQLADADVVGPGFFWDPGKRLLLPPAEQRTRRAELRRALATRGDPWTRLARRRFRRHARRHWDAQAPLRSSALSGALLAFRRSAWDAVGPFDEGFALYFEENDWLARADRRDLRLRYVPAAAAVHHYNQGAQREARAQRWFEQSEARFARRYYGDWFAALRRAVTAATPGILAPPRLPAGAPELPAAAFRGVDGPWVEVAAGGLRFPAAAERLRGAEEGWRLPDSVWFSLAPGEYFVTVVGEDGREHGVWAFARP